MKTQIFIVLLTACMLSSAVWAKRADPPSLDPVVQDNIQYFPRNSPAFWAHFPKDADEAKEYFCGSGCIKAWDLQSNRELWTLEVYSIEVNPALEGDIQDVCIKQMYLQNGKLIVINERDDKFIIDVQKKTVSPGNKAYKMRRAQGFWGDRFIHE